GSAADEAFMNQVLHLAYAGDNAANLTVTGVGSHFSGISFNYGSAPYIEDWPDYFTPLNGGELALQYGNSRNAAISYRNASSATFVMGFAFETIDTENSRSELLGRVLQYFAGTADVEDIENPLRFSISGIYPNPFNASVRIEYWLESRGDAALSIFDLHGREVLNQRISGQGPAQYTWQWNGLDQAGRALPSGAYLIRLQQGHQVTATRKLILLK
ncbi:MAG: T9SS type A sorting domain-containing protein, partial [Candidatus Marinimicrobia bacterium]|nr:T9SS type A sorting domain-containing protein [Candidatus Neomarinimicrobiota bacterium]